MNLIELIVAFGVTMGLIAVLIAFLAQKLVSHSTLAGRRPFVPRTPGAGIGAITGPAALFSRLGQNDKAHRTPNTIVMRPTRGARIFNLTLIGLMMFVMFGPGGEVFRNDALTVTLVVSATLFVTLYLTFYEVSYDAEGVTAPTWYFRRRTLLWEDLISIRDDGHHLYKLRFRTDVISINKYLVGMPTFLTFVTDVSETNRRA